MTALAGFAWGLLAGGFAGAAVVIVATALRGDRRPRRPGRR